jgi:anti-sigma regulatory factor (Ser/Thr protein kinase)
MAQALLVEMAASRADLSQLLEQFGEFAALHDLPADVRRDVHLVLDEIVSNVIGHGQAEGSPCHITVRMALARDILRIDITDDGRPFDPLTAPTPPIEAALADRSPGGLGIHLVRHLADRLTYTRRNGRNHLVVHRAIVKRH